MSLAPQEGMVTTTVPPQVERFVQLVHAEYREMPGLHLTKPQMRRFLGIDENTCDVVLDRLEHEHFLKRTPDNAYVLQS